MTIAACSRSFQFQIDLCASTPYRVSVLQIPALTIDIHIFNTQSSSIVCIICIIVKERDEKVNVLYRDHQSF